MVENKTDQIQCPMVQAMCQKMEQCPKAQAMCQKMKQCCGAVCCFGQKASCCFDRMCPKALFLGGWLALAAMLVLGNYFALPTWLQMQVYSLSILYIASHLSLGLIAKSEGKDGEEGEVRTTGEIMTKAQAKMAPIMGSATLLSIYVAYKVFGKWALNLVIVGYMSLVGGFAIAEALVPVLMIMQPTLSGAKKYKIKFPAALKEYLGSEIEVAAHEVALTALGFVISGTFCITRNWVCHNLIAIGFCQAALAQISIGNMRNASLLLAGLFFYDIFWVFGSDVMLTVAVAVDAPVKILFPVSIDPFRTSLLGLGDVVVPGLLIALCLRYDAVRAKVNLNSMEKFTTKFPKTYFKTAMLSYSLALLLTAAICVIFKHGQPALLYIVPAVLAGVYGRAHVHGEMKELLAYDETQAEEEAAEEKAEEKAEKVEDSAENEDSAEYEDAVEDKKDQ